MGDKMGLNGTDHPGKGGAVAASCKPAYTVAINPFTAGTRGIMNRVALHRTDAITAEEMEDSERLPCLSINLLHPFNREAST